MIRFYLFDAFLPWLWILEADPRNWLRLVLDTPDGPTTLRTHGIRGLAL